MTLHSTVADVTARISERSRVPAVAMHPSASRTAVASAPAAISTASPPILSAVRQARAHRPQRERRHNEAE